MITRFDNAELLLPSCPLVLGEKQPSLKIMKIFDRVKEGKNLVMK